MQADSQSSSPLRALRHRNFQLYAAGQLVSLTGSWVHNTALSWLMYRLTHSEWQLGLMSLFANLPMLLLGMVGGLAADRFPRKRIVLITQTIFLLQAAVLAVLTLSGVVKVWQVYSLGLMFGLANAFVIPARQAMLLDMSSKEDLISAVSLNSMIFNLARIVGPGIGGLAVAAIGEGWCFAANAVSFLAVLTGLILMQLPVRKVEAVAGTLREGFRYVGEDIRAWRLLLLCGMMNVGFSGVFVLGPFFAEDIFGKGAWGLGWITASMGVGAVLGTYLVAGNRDAIGLPRISVLSGLMLGAALAAYGMSPSYWLSLPLMAIAGGSLMRQNAATNSTLQTAAPERLRGRVVSMFGTAVVGMAPIGAALFGGLARVTGVRVAAVSAGVLCLGSAAWVGRGLRRAGALMLLAGISFGADRTLVGKVDVYLQEASKLSGFSVKKKVPAAMMNAKELEKYLAGKTKAEVDTHKVDLEELVLKRFGFAPEDFKLRETTLALLNEQAAAFYDFKDKRLYVLEHSSEDMGPELMIHELGHALADQHYGLRKFLTAAKDDDDAALARMAVMEGQAMWLMGEHAAQSVGMHLKDSPELVARLSKADEGGDDRYPVMQKVPLYLKESLLFPYSYGFKFQAAVCQKEADCISRVFERPPASSAQVMHPELYFAGVLPEKVKVPGAPREGKWKAIVEGSLGEIDFDLLLRTFSISSEGVADGSRGGGYRLYENRKTRDILLTYASVWKDETAARKWFEAYARLLASKWKKCEIAKRADTEISGVGDRGGFRLRLDGRTVTAEEGLPVH